MISRSDDRRRILDLPAVRPCESVSPSTLLGSLIALSHSISGSRSRSRFFFPTQRRNARESIRLVGVLLVFFEHLRDRPPSLLRSLLLSSSSPSSSEESSLVIALSELHFALQKLLFLLEDCGARPGARVWVLMKSRLVAAQFQIAVRSIATALDVMPDLESDRGRDADSDLEEVREMVRMVGRQARKAKWEAVEIADQLAAERVSFVLNQFENKYEPERGLIKRLLDYLGIRTWNECNQEVKFLEEEIAFRCTDVEGRRGGGGRKVAEEDRGREMPQLSSLLALMCYCRGVIFDEDHLASTEEFHRTGDRLILPPPAAGLAATAEEEEDSSSLSSYVLFRCLNPEDFRCPISLELMTDPVTVSTGQTYDRVSIQKWLRSGNMICPKTGERLTSRELVPNSALKRLIQQFFSDYGISISRSSSSPRDHNSTSNSNTTTTSRSSDTSRTTTAAFPGTSGAAREAIRFLSEFLTARLTYGTDQQKNKAAHESRLLAKQSVYNRTLLVDVGAVPPLLDLLTSSSPTSQENSIAALLKLSKHPSGQKSIVENGGLTLILSVVRAGLRPESRQIAAAVIFYLASAEKYRRWIGRNRDAIPALVELVRDGTFCGKRNAMAAVFGLLLHHGNRERALTAGIVPHLIDVVGGSERGELVGDALAILAALAEGVDGSVAILQRKGLETVMSVVKSGAVVGRAGREYCVSVLYSLCLNGGEEVVETVAREESGQVMPFLYGMSVVEGSAAKKARGLINMLQMHRESSTSSSRRRMVEPRCAAAVCKEREDGDEEED